MKPAPSLLASELVPSALAVRERKGGEPVGGALSAETLRARLAIDGRPRALVASVR